MMRENEFLAAARLGKNELWRYLLTTGLAWGLNIGFSVFLLLFVFIATGTQSLNGLPENWYLVVVMLPFVLIIAGLWFGQRFLHHRPFRSLVVPPAERFRWGNVFLSAILWFGLSALSDLLISALSPGNYVWSFDARRFYPYLVLALLLIPFQTSAEELFFRGYLAQGFGLLGRGSWLLAWLVPSILFGLLHSWNPEVSAYGLGWELASVTITGLLLGWVTLRSRGLELALGLHAANNIYSAMVVTFPSSAIPSPALFAVKQYDPRLGILSLIIMVPIYLLILSIWKSGKAWRLLLLSALLLSACAPAVRPPSAGLAPTIPLADCRLSAPGFSIQYAARCGQLSVLENPADPTGRKINLYFAVLPARSQNKSDDPLFLLAGGPGQAATEAFVPTIAALDKVRFKRDLVLVDQRGTGQSHPLSCPVVKGGEARLDQDQPLETQLAQVEACAKSVDADPRFYTTDIAMQDLDQVRQALGYQKINLLGVSYGTRTAQAYLRLFPERVRTMILDGVVPPDWALGDSVAADAQRALNLTSARCQSDTACSAAFPDTAKALSTVLDRLDQAPVKLDLPDPTTGEETSVTLTRADAALTVRMMLYSTEYTALLPLIIHHAAQGDLQPLAAQYLVIVKSFSESLSDGMYMSVICSEDVPFYPAQPAAAAGFFQYDQAAVREQCQRWPHKQADPALRQPVRSDVPTLLFSGEADPVTPPANAERVALGLPNSKQLVVKGLGHNVSYRGCLPKVINEFLEAGKTEGINFDCLATIQPQPFFLTYTGPKP